MGVDFKMVPVVAVIPLGLSVRGKGFVVEFEEKAASIVRTIAILCLGTIVVLTVAFKASLEAALYLGFTNEESRDIALGVTAVTAGLGALFGVHVTLPQAEDRASASPGRPGPWVHKQRVPIEVGKWYSVSRKDELTGMYHSTIPEGDFTGVAYTHNDALHYVKKAQLPTNTIAWLCPDETKFVAVTQEVPTGDKGTFLVECTNGDRVCCTRGVNAWWSEDGRSKSYYDDFEEVVRWVEIPDPPSQERASG